MPGKPAPDTFLEAARRVGVPRQQAVVVEAIAGDLVAPNTLYNAARTEEAKQQARDEAVLPLERAAELRAEGLLGELAPTHYSFMGFLLRPETFLAESVPRMIDRMRAEEVDAVLLVPVAWAATAWTAVCERNWSPLWTWTRKRSPGR